MAVLVPTVRVEGPKILRVVSKVKVVLRRDVSYAEVEFPKIRGVDLSTFRKGDEVKIYLGERLIGEMVVFWGKVVEVSPTLPLRFRAEDWLGELANFRYSQLYSGVNDMADIVEDAIQRAGLDAHVVKPSPYSERDFRVDNHTALQVVKRAIERTGFGAWNIPGTKTIYFGPIDAYARGELSQEKVFVLRFGYNVVRNDLKYKPKEAVGKVVVWLVDSDFRHPAVKGEYGDSEPVKVYSFKESFNNNPTEARQKAERRARELYLKANTDSYTGTIETYLNPFILPGHVVKLEDPEHTERSGRFYVDEVVHTFSSAGARTRLKIGGSVSS